MEINDMERIFLEEYGDGEGKIYTFFSPGRVNLIGEHIDYNGGFVFPAALTIGIYGSLRYRNDNLIRLRSKNINGEVIINLDEPLVYKDEDNWANYPKGIIKNLLAEGHNIKGMDLLFYSTLPDGAGLSSSASLEVLMAYIMLYMENPKNIDRVKISKLCQNVENEFIGVNCGIMDQFSVALGKKDNAILLNCDTLEYKYVPLNLEKYTLVIMNTNKRRELSESKYNERKMECETAVDLINKSKKTKINNLCEASLEDIEKCIIDETVKKRAIHVVTENERVKEAVNMLQKGKIEKFGELISESHKSLRYNYEVTGFHLDTLVDKAAKIDGCIGARMTGAGFGGCAIALVENEEVEAFKYIVSKAYKRETNIDAAFYTSNIGDGVFLMEI